MNFWEKGESQANGNGANKRGNGTPPNNNRNNGNGNGFDNSTAQAQNVSEQIAKFGNMNEQQLMSELLRTAGCMKAGGKLSGEDLEKFYSAASAFLSKDQLLRLRELINLLK